MSTIAARSIVLPTLLGALTLAGLTACQPAVPPLGTPPSAVPDRDSARLGPRLTPASSRGIIEKRVYAKRMPDTLIASDGSRCTVSDDVFRDTRIQDLVRCAWVETRAPDPTTGAP